MTCFSLEFRLVLACCSSPAGDARDDGIRLLASQGPAWSGLLALARRHRVIGFVHAGLASAKVKLPKDIGRDLAIASLKIRRQNEENARETVRIQKMLDAANIPVLFFKGTTLAQSLYGRIDTKHSKDIDALVLPEDAQAFVRLLEKDGYRLLEPLPAMNAAQWRAALHFAKDGVMEHAGTGLQVEPHWRLTWNPHLLRAFDARTRTIDIDLPSFGKARTFTHDDLFVYLCVHGAVHGWIRLKWLVDLHMMIAGLPAQDIERLYRHAEHLGAAPCAALALAMCERVFGLPIPPGLKGEIRNSWALRKLEKLAMASMLGDEEQPRWFPSMAAHLLLSFEQGHFFSQIWRALTGISDPIAYPLPAPLHFLYVLARLPLGIIRRIARKRTSARSSGAALPSDQPAAASVQAATPSTI